MEKFDNYCLGISLFHHPPKQSTRDDCNSHDDKPRPRKQFIHCAINSVINKMIKIAGDKPKSQTAKK